MINLDTVAQVFRSIRFGERVSLQLRWEMYNAFNHTQFDAVNATAQSDAAGRLTNTQLDVAAGEFLGPTCNFPFLY